MVTVLHVDDQDAVKQGERRFFTDAEDRFIIANYSRMTLRDIGMSLGRKWQSIQWRAVVLTRDGRLTGDRFWQRSWTEADLDLLAELWGTMPDRLVAKRLNRTVNACKIQTVRKLKINRSMAVYNARLVGRIFGVNCKTVVTWARKGWIKATPSHISCGKTKKWDVDPVSLERFVKKMPWAYDWRKMAAGEYLTNLAWEINTKDPWVEVDEAARIAGINPETMRRWCRHGLITAKRRPKYRHAGPQYGKWVVRKRDILPTVKERERLRRERSLETMRKARAARFGLANKTKGAEVE